MTDVNDVRGVKLAARQQQQQIGQRLQKGWDWGLGCRLSLLGGGEEKLGQTV